MSKPIIFLVGLATGIYIDQTYKIPSVSSLVDRAIKYAKENEKK
jgi:hypothetical protein